MNRGHIPIRICAGCHNRRPAKEMIRVKVSERSLLVTDNKTNFGGRSCYICPSVKCAEKALKKRRLEKALRAEILMVPSVESILKKGLEKKGCADDHFDR